MYKKIIFDQADCYYGLGQLLMEYESAVCGVEELVEEDGDGAKWEEVLIDKQHIDILTR